MYLEPYLMDKNISAQFHHHVVDDGCSLLMHVGEQNLNVEEYQNLSGKKVFFFHTENPEKLNYR